MRGKIVCLFLIALSCILIFEASAEILQKCLLPADSGPCKASIWRYRYNQDTNMCEQFIYGGCNGNENNFKTLEDCQRSCS